ncbi:MAG: phosphoribosylformylglycinamidine synthase subunit PurS, partial [Rubrobacteraceae bacterium]
MKIRVLVRPKEGILDPQGEAVRSALPALGFDGVETVHI